MTKADKSLILNRLVGIPFKALNNASTEEIDSFIERNNLAQYMTTDFLKICEADRQILKWLRTK